MYIVFYSLEFGTAPATEPGAPPVLTNDILAMISPEKENVPLMKVSDFNSYSIYHDADLRIVASKSSW